MTLIMKYYKKDFHYKLHFHRDMIHRDFAEFPRVKDISVLKLMC